MCKELSMLRKKYCITEVPNVLLNKEGIEHYTTAGLWKINYKHSKDNTNCTDNKNWKNWEGWKVCGGARGSPRFHVVAPVLLLMFMTKWSLCHRHPDLKKNPAKNQKPSTSMEAPEHNNAGRGCSPLCARGASVRPLLLQGWPFPVTHHCSLPSADSELPPDEGAGSLKGLAEGRGGEHGIPFESSAQLPSEILAAVLTPPLITAAAWEARGEESGFGMGG
jgi:hypothetical protein